MSYCLINSVNSGYCTRLLIPHTFRERSLSLSLVSSHASYYVVRSEGALELRRIRLSDCWSFIALFSKADLEFAWVVGLLRLSRMVLWYMFIDQCIGGQVPVKLIAGWLWSDSQMRTVFCVTLLLQLGKNYHLHICKILFSLLGDLSLIYSFS